MRIPIDLNDDIVDEIFIKRLYDDMALLQRSGTFLPVFSSDPEVEAKKVAEMIDAYRLVLSYNEPPV
jgi:hypothetical protein